MSFTLSYATKVRAQQHALNTYPDPSRGLVIGESYLPVEVGSLDELVSLARDRGASAVVYSKPDKGAYPDEKEMLIQKESGIPFGVIGGNQTTMDVPYFWGDDVEIAPMIGRPFVHGIWDCYSLVRDAYRLGREGMAAHKVNWPHNSIILPDVPRNDGWWNAGQDLYMEWLKPAGFIEITASMAKPGDGFLMKIRSDQLNHAGLLVSDNEILHHLPTRLSRREIGGLWFRQVQKWVRYQG